MSSRWRAVLGIGVSIGILLGTGILSASAQAADPRIGTWKLNVAKSKYSPGPAPQSQTLKIEAVGKGEKVTSEVVNTDGTKATTQYTANFDGEDYAVTGSPNWDAVTLRHIDRFTTEETDKKAGKVVQTAKVSLLRNGKTVIVSATAMDVRGQRVSENLIFEK